jgi:hypothetical protein
MRLRGQLGVGMRDGLVACGRPYRATLVNSLSLSVWTLDQLLRLLVGAAAVAADEKSGRLHS